MQRVIVRFREHGWSQDVTSGRSSELLSFELCAENLLRGDRVEGTVRDDLAADGGVKVARGRGNRTGIPCRPSNQPDPDRSGCGELSDIYLLFQERKWL